MNKNMMPYFEDLGNSSNELGGCEGLDCYSDIIESLLQLLICIGYSFVEQLFRQEARMLLTMKKRIGFVSVGLCFKTQC